MSIESKNFGHEQEGPSYKGLRVKLLQESEILGSVGRRFLSADEGLGADVFGIVFTEDDLKREEEFDFGFDEQLAMMFAEIYAGAREVGLASEGEDLQRDVFIFNETDDDRNAGLKRVFVEFVSSGKYGSFTMGVLSAEDHFLFQKDDLVYDLVIETDGLGRVVGERLHLFDPEKPDKIYDVKSAVFWLEKENNSVVTVGITNKYVEFEGIAGDEHLAWTDFSKGGESKFGISNYFFEGLIYEEDSVSEISFAVDLGERLLAVKEQKLLGDNTKRLVTLVFNIRDRRKLNVDLGYGPNLRRIRDIVNQPFFGTELEFVYERDGSGLGYEGEPVVYLDGDRQNAAKFEMVADEEEKIQLIESRFPDYFSNLIIGQLFVGDGEELDDEKEADAVGGVAGEKTLFGGVSVWVSRAVRSKNFQGTKDLYLLLEEDGSLSEYVFVKPRTKKKKIEVED